MRRFMVLFAVATFVWLEIKHMQNTHVNGAPFYYGGIELEGEDFVPSSLDGVEFVAVIAHTAHRAFHFPVLTRKNPTTNFTLRPLSMMTDEWGMGNFSPHFSFHQLEDTF